MAIIPAKAFSRRVTKKNMRLFNGKPLLFYTIDAALKSSAIDEVYVSTDSEEIKSYAESLGAKVPFLRLAEHSGDNTHSSVPVLDLLEKIGGSEKYSFCLTLLPTAPLRKTESLNKIVELSKKHQRNVLAVTDLGHTVHHLRTTSDGGELKRFGSEEVYNFQTQDAPHVFALSSVGQCAPVGELLKHRTFQYRSPLGYVVSKLEAADIDTEEDFILAERLAITSADKKI